MKTFFLRLFSLACLLLAIKFLITPNFFCRPLGRDQAQGGTQGGPKGRPLPGAEEVCGWEQGHARGQGRPGTRGSLQAEEEVVWT